MYTLDMLNSSLTHLGFQLVVPESLTSFALFSHRLLRPLTRPLAVHLSIYTNPTPTIYIGYGVRCTPARAIPCPLKYLAGDAGSTSAVRMVAYSFQLFLFCLFFKIFAMAFYTLTMIELRFDRGTMIQEMS
jgi:hypothetical protein